MTDEQLAVVTRLFDLVGATLSVPERMIDSVSSISGSGPAYFYYIVEQLTIAAIGKGFTPARRRRFSPRAPSSGRRHSSTGHPTGRPS